MLKYTNLLGLEKYFENLKDEELSLINTYKSHFELINDKDKSDHSTNDDKS